MPLRSFLPTGYARAPRPAGTAPRFVRVRCLTRNFWPGLLPWPRRRSEADRMATGFPEVFMTKISAVIVSMLCVAAAPAAQIPEQDVRNTDIYESNSVYKMPVFASREAWLERAAFLRKQILASAG